MLRSKNGVTVKVCLMCLCLWGWTGTALAENEAIPNAGRITLALGVGEYDTLLNGQSSLPLYVLPHWSYYGERFYIDNLDLGINLVESEHWSWDLTSLQSTDALLFRQGSLKASFLKGLSTDLLIAIPWGSEAEKLFQPTKRHFSYLAGSTLFWRSEAWQLSSGYHQDASGVHDGGQWRSEARYLYQQGAFSLALSGAARWLSREYSNYYFGISLQDTSNTYQFQPGAQWLPSFKLETSWRLAQDTRLVLSWRREWLPSAYSGSFHIGQDHHDIWFTGVTWTW